MFNYSVVSDIWTVSREQHGGIFILLLMIVFDLAAPLFPFKTQSFVVVFVPYITCQ